MSVWLTGEAVWFAVPGRQPDLELPYATPVAELIETVRLAGAITVCTQCAARRELVVQKTWSIPRPSKAPRASLRRRWPTTSRRWSTDLIRRVPHTRRMPILNVSEVSPASFEASCADTHHLALAREESSEHLRRSCRPAWHPLRPRVGLSLASR